MPSRTGASAWESHKIGLWYGDSPARPGPWRPGLAFRSPALWPMDGPSNPRLRGPEASELVVTEGLVVPPKSRVVTFDSEHELGDLTAVGVGHRDCGADRLVRLVDRLRIARVNRTVPLIEERSQLLERWLRSEPAPIPRHVVLLNLDHAEQITAGTVEPPDFAEVATCCHREDPNRVEVALGLEEDRGRLVRCLLSGQPVC